MVYGICITSGYTRLVPMSLFIIIYGIDFNEDARAISNFFFDPGVREFEVTKVTGHMWNVRGVYTSSVILRYVGGTLDPAHGIEDTSSCNNFCFQRVCNRFDL
jgi:hypothetical protein